MEAQYTHRPVLLAEVLEGLRIHADGVYVDATFGRGGHAGAILQKLGPQGRLLAMDRDPDAVESAERQYGSDPRFAIEHGTFAMLGRAIAERQLIGRVDGLLLDLGVSSPQLDDAGRGFSFLDDGPLDMRMDPGAGESAAQWLAGADEQAITAVLRDYGEERFAKRMARAVVQRREQQPFTRTADLAQVSAAAVEGPPAARFAAPDGV